jgi:hypothetical protein
LFYHTQNGQYALEEERHEIGHMNDMLNFKPKFLWEPRMQVCFELFLTSDKHCFPCTVGLIPVPGFSVIQSAQFPWLMYFLWSTETLRSYFVYMKSVTKDCSEGDAALYQNPQTR